MLIYNISMVIIKASSCISGIYEASHMSLTAVTTMFVEHSNTGPIMLYD